MIEDDDIAQFFFTLQDGMLEMREASTEVSTTRNNYAELVGPINSK